MSFRNRLTVFFIVLVVLPMVVVATVGFVLASDSEEGKTDARLSQARRSASGLFREQQDQAQGAAGALADDQELADAVQRGKRGPIQQRFDALARADDVRRGVMRLRKAGRFETGGGDAVAPARTRLLDSRGAGAGGLTLSTATAPEYAQRVHRVTGVNVVVISGGGLVASTLP